MFNGNNKGNRNYYPNNSYNPNNKNLKGNFRNFPRGDNSNQLKGVMNLFNNNGLNVSEKKDNNPNNYSNKNTGSIFK